MRHPSRASSRRWPLLQTAITATIALLICGGALVSAPANAAGDYTTNASIDSLRFTSESTQSGSDAAIAGTWSLPDNPATPAGFTIDLPAELQGRSDRFPMRAPDGSAMGTCTVTATQLDCAIDDAYVAAHPLNLHGDVTFWVTVETPVDTPTEKTYTIDGKEVTTTVTPAPDGTCTSNCDFTGRDDAKTGTYDSENGIIDWTVSIASGKDGMEGGQTVTVTDTPGPNQELVDTAYGQPMPTLWVATGTYVNSAGTEVVGPWEQAPRDSYTSTPGSLTFTTTEGSFYDVHFATRITDGGAAGTYTNSAAITIQGRSGTPVDGTVVYQGGGGSGSGESPSPAPSPTPTPTPTPSPEPTPSPTSRPEPSPSPKPETNPDGATVNTGGAVADRPHVAPFVAVTAIGLALLSGAVALHLRGRRHARR